MSKSIKLSRLEKGRRVAVSAKREAERQLKACFTPAERAALESEIALHGKYVEAVSREISRVEAK